MGQYHSVSARMILNYRDEFVYRYNNRKETDARFNELLKKQLEDKN